MAPRMAQDALGATIAGEGAPPRRKRMDYLTRALVLRLREGDSPMSYEQIATTLGISESSARRICQFDAADHKASIKRLMRTGDLERIEDWAKASRISAKRGYFQAAQSWLQATDAIDAKPAQVQANVNVAPTVHLTMPFGLGALKDYQPQAPAIDVQPVPALPSGDAMRPGPNDDTGKD